MKLKKFLAGVGTLCLALILCLPLQAYAQEETGSTTIKTDVPDTHLVLLDIGEHGSVLINGKSYTHADSEAEIGRLTEQKYIIQAESGWQIESVLYGKAGVQEYMELTDNAFTAPAVNSDGNKLTVTFKQASGSAGGTDTGGATQDKGGNAQTSVQTGDTANVMFWGALLLLSCFVISGAYVVNLRKGNR